MSALQRWLRPSLTGPACLILGLTLAGCGVEPDQENQEREPPRRPGPVDEVEWSIDALDYDVDMGFRLRMSIADDGRIGLAFFGFEPATGEPCDEIQVETPPNKLMWALHFAERGADGTWTQEIVHEVPYVSSPQGIDLAYDHQGRAVVATMTGQPIPEIRYCGVNDVGVLWREGPGNWSQETAVSTSGEAATGEPASDYGFVVGYWPGLAIDSTGQPAVAYRDVHAGGIQADDFRRADLEFTHRAGGSWGAEPVDWGRGAGEFNRLAFDDADQPVIAFYTGQESNIAERLGYWVAWRNEGEWEFAHLFNRGNTEPPALAIHPETGELHVAFYDSEFGAPKVVTLSDWGSFTSVSQWSFEEVGDPTYDEGYSPSLAISESGRLGLAYYRCALASEGLGNCSPARTALVFAYQDGGEWVQEVVEEGGTLAACGQAPQLEFDGEEAVIAYRCEVLEDDVVTTEVRIARRPALD